MAFDRVLSRLYNVPLLIDESKLEIINSEVTVKLLTGAVVASNPGISATSKEINASSTSIAVIKVFDSLVSKNAAGDSGTTSYESIKQEIDLAIKNGFSKIGFYIDSPGGEAFGNFPLADYIASLPAKGIETFAFTDGLMHSGAYSIGSACQTIYATESSSLGSIGTLMTLVDKTKIIENSGMKVTVLRSKSEKALGSPIEGYDEKALAKYETILMELDNLFNKTVATNRPVLTIEDIIATKGSSFMANEALGLKLFDKIVMNFDEAMQIEANCGPKRKTTINGELMTLEEMKAELAAKEAKIAELQSNVNVAVSQAVASERTRCLDILASAKVLKISDDVVNKRISAGSSKEDSLEIFTAIAEAVGVTNQIDTSTTAITETITTAATANVVSIFGHEVNSSDILSSLKGAK